MATRPATESRVSPAARNRSILLTVLGLFAVAAAPQQPSDPPVVTERESRATPPRRGASFLDAPVFDGGGHALGRVWDLVAASDGRLTALIQSRERGLVGVPLARLDWRDDPGRPTTAGRAILQVTADELLRSPTLVSGDAVDGEWLRRLSEYYDMPDGASAGPPLRLRRLLGAAADDASGRPCGEVLDFAVDLADSRVAYLLLCAGTGRHRGRRVHGVPWSDVLASRHPGRVSLDVTSVELDSAPGLALDSLPARPDVTPRTLHARDTSREDHP